MSSRHELDLSRDAEFRQVEIPFDVEGLPAPLLRPPRGPQTPRDVFSVSAADRRARYINARAFGASRQIHSRRDKRGGPRRSAADSPGGRAGGHQSISAAKRIAWKHVSTTCF